MTDGRSEGGTGAPTVGEGGLSVPLSVHVAELRRADREFNEARREADRDWSAERDRRLSEVAVEREKALRIKETADLAALDLAREIQTYKDEKANELREQIGSERGLYATKEDLTAAIREIVATIKPLSEYVQLQQGRSQGIGLSAGALVGALSALGAVVGFFILLASVLPG